MARSTRNVLTWWNDYLTSSLRRHWMSAFMIDVILMKVITFPSGIAKQQQMLKPFKAISHFIRNKFLPTLFQQKVSYLLVTHTERERESEREKMGKKFRCENERSSTTIFHFPLSPPKTISTQRLNILLCTLLSLPSCRRIQRKNHWKVPRWR